jgi:hypothetical protein
MANIPTRDLIDYVKCTFSPLVGREVFNFVQVVTDKVVINNVGSAVKKDLVLYAKASGEAQPTKVVPPTEVLNISSIDTKGFPFVLDSIRMTCRVGLEDHVTIDFLDSNRDAKIQVLAVVKSPGASGAFDLTMREYEVSVSLKFPDLKHEGVTDVDALRQVADEVKEVANHLIHPYRSFSKSSTMLPVGGDDGCGCLEIRVSENRPIVHLSFLITSFRPSHAGWLADDITTRAIGTLTEKGYTVEAGSKSMSFW